MQKALVERTKKPIKAANAQLQETFAKYRTKATWAETKKGWVLAEDDKWRAKGLETSTEKRTTIAP